MCGICVSVSDSDAYRAGAASILSWLKSRGPDQFSVTGIVIPRPLSIAENPSENPQLHLNFCSSVLSLRGNNLVSQPVFHRETGTTFCWNGEAWKFENNVVQHSDTELIFNSFLGSALSGQSDFNISFGTSFGQRRVLDQYFWTIASIQGPFAFVFYDARHQLLLYGRDRLGRRSLVQRLPYSIDGLTIASVCGDTETHVWEEIAADGIYHINLADSTGPRPVCTPWSEVTRRSRTTVSLSINEALPPGNVVTLGLESQSVKQLHERLAQSLVLRVLEIPSPPNQHEKSSISSPKIAILFSGGLDCTVLARLADDILPKSEPIDLLNVAFENPRVVSASQDPFNEHSQPRPDSRLPIDSPRPSPYDLCPDRRTAETSYTALLAACPNRNFRIIKINIPYTTYLNHLPTIKHLIHPHNTEMDLSIGTALYFASRGSGHITTPTTTTPQPYTTPARILFSGLGADELFGGYARHARAFERPPTDKTPHASLIAELSLDFDRLGQRNLGRDDRVIAHWGREVRYPYLDEEFVSWALGLPVWEKCGFGEPAAAEGDGAGGLEPGKKVLRLLTWKLGMEGVAREKKRAIQFGARTAKMTAGRVKGTQVLD